MSKLTRRTLLIFWQHAAKYPVVVFVLGVSIIVPIATELALPYFYKQLFNTLAGDGSNTGALQNIIFKILITGAIGWLFWRIATFTNDYFQPRVMGDLLNTCFSYIHNHSFNFFGNHFAGSIVKKIARFERAFQEIADQTYWNIIPAIVKMAVILAVLYTVNQFLALITLVWCAFYVAFSFGYARFKLRYDLVNAELDTEVGGRMADTITNNINLKLFDGLGREYREFKKLTDKQFRARKWTWDLTSINESIQGAFMVALEFGLLYAAVGLWQAGRLTIGDFALLQGYLLQLFTRLWDLGRNIKNIYARLGDAEEMTAVLTMPHEVKDEPGARPLHVPSGRIEFADVTFGYLKHRPILNNFNLRVEPGEKVALIGPSGGGKTTIVKLLFRFFDLQAGRIFIDGQDICRVTQESLRANLALVPQEPILFHRSLYDNIAYGKQNSTKEEVYEAARLAHCQEFIDSFPEGYNTFVGERGVKLSGGERQRVAIARAILRNAPILVLDEATSNLDSESEMLIQDALRNLMNKRTTIVIAHRLSTIMQMDRIVVVKKGHIIEEGKHEELVKAREGMYQRLWEIQARGFNY